MDMESNTSTDQIARPFELRLTIDGVEHRFVKAFYTPGRYVRHGPDDVVITPGGRIRLGTQFVGAHHVSQDTRAYLYWDDSKKIAISFAQDRAPSAYPIQVTAQTTSARVDARRFFKKNLPKVNRAQYAGVYHCEVKPAGEVGITDVDGDVCIIDLGERHEQSPRTAAAPRPTTPSTDAVRAWAKEHGYQVGERGRLPKYAVTAYEAANQQSLSRP
jgi:hypothetical protein